LEWLPVRRSPVYAANIVFTKPDRCCIAGSDGCAAAAERLVIKARLKRLLRARAAARAARSSALRCSSHNARLGEGIEAPELLSFCFKSIPAEAAMTRLR
jgi:hypothetical protein